MWGDNYQVQEIRLVILWERQGLYLRDSIPIVMVFYQVSHADLRDVINTRGVRVSPSKSHQPHSTSGELQIQG